MRKRVQVGRYFRLMSEDEIREFSGGHGLLMWLSSAGISTYAAYSFMKERFGPPQHKAKTLREYDKVQWTFYIKSNNSMLTVYDWKLFEWSIGVATRMLRPGVSHEDIISAEEESRAMADAKLLLSEIRKYARTIRSIPIAKHSYQLIENVFQTNYSRAQDIFDLMESEPQYNDQASALSWAAAVSYVFSIEGLFNLIYDVYLKKEIRENAGLYEHLQRLSLADKWSLASHVCYCFKDHLKTSSRGYQNLKKLVNLRNEWAHSSITPEMRTFFLREDDLAFATTAAPIHAGYEFGQEISFVKRIKRETDTVVSELLGAVAPEFKTSFSHVLIDGAVSLDAQRVPLRGPRHDYWP